MYLKNMRPYICFEVNTLIQFLEDSRHVHLVVAKHVLRYLKRIIEYGIKYYTNQKTNLYDYANSYWTGNATDRKSTSSCCFSLRSSMISWFSRKKSCIALSTAEAEYVATCSASCEVVWFQKLLSDLFDLTYIFVWCKEEQWSFSMCSGTQGTPKRMNNLSNRFTQVDHRSTHRCLSRG